MLCWFSLPIRTISVGFPFNRAMTMELLNTTRAIGREKRTKMRPVIAASKNIPVIISTVLTTCP